MPESKLRLVNGSSLIAADGWNEAGDVLTVKYHNNSIYEFHAISPDMRKAYEAAASKGQYLKRSIEPNIKGVRV